MNRSKLVPHRGSLTACIALLLTQGFGMARGSEEARSSLKPSDWQAIRDLHHDHVHGFEATSSGHLARMPRHGLHVEVLDGTAKFAPVSGSWSWSLKLRSIDRSGSSATFESSTVRVSKNELELEWSPDVTEWYVNRADGLEHGFTLQSRPHAGMGVESPLEIHLSLGGTTEVRADADSLGIDAHDASGSKVLDYDGLIVVDADGAVIPARLDVAGDTLTIIIDDRDASYPLTVDPTVQAGFLKASLGDQGDAFGSSIAVSGDTVVVGAPNEQSGLINDPTNNSTSRAGAAYVFLKTPGGWTQTGYLKANNVAFGQAMEFGSSVDILGDRIVVGATREGSFSGVVNGPLTPGQPASSAAGYRSGAAFVFRLENGTWVAESVLKPAQIQLGQAYFGWSVAMSEQRIVVGAPEDSAATSRGGAAYVFSRTGNDWMQEAVLTAPLPTSRDEFGASVDIDLDTIIVGARGEDSDSRTVSATVVGNNNRPESGAAYTYVFNGASWSFENHLKSSNADAGDGFGWSVAIDGSVAVVGALGEDSNATSSSDNSIMNSGAAYVFERVGNLWGQTSYLKASNPGAMDLFGEAVAIAGPRMIVGASGEDSLPGPGNGGPTANPASNAGAAYLFLLANGVWSEALLLKADDADAGDLYGVAVAIDGTLAVVGASNESSQPGGSSTNPLDNSAPGAGAGYALDVDLFPTTHCVSTPNSTGQTAALGWSGSLRVSDNSFTLDATQMPVQQFGMFLISRTAGSSAGANGNLCLSGTIGRFDLPSQILNSGAAGAFSLTIDLTAVPNGPTPVSVLACETWYFQTWFRDIVGFGADFSDGLAVMFL